VRIVMTVRVFRAGLRQAGGCAAGLQRCSVQQQTLAARFARPSDLPTWRMAGCWGCVQRWIVAATCLTEIEGITAANRRITSTSGRRLSPYRYGSRWNNQWLLYPSDAAAYASLPPSSRTGNKASRSARFSGLSRV